MSALLPFAQLDLPGRIALAEARYLVRPVGDPDADPDVLAIRVLGSPRASGRLRRGRQIPLDSEPGATPLPMTRATLVKARPFADDAAAASWLAEVTGSRDLSAGLAREAVATLNRGLDAHRRATLDPYVFDLHPGMAVAIRIGYGSGDEVADGLWTEARELSERERTGLQRRIDDVGAQERVAASLGGRDEARAAAGLLADARRELDGHRPAGATLRLRAALTALAVDEGRGSCPPEAEESVAAAEAVLRRGGEPDREPLDSAHREISHAVLKAGRSGR